MSTTTVSGPGDTPQAEQEPVIVAPEIDAVLDEMVAEGLVVESVEPEIAIAGAGEALLTSVSVIEMDGTETDITGLLDKQTGELFDTAGYRIETPTFDNLASDKLILSLGGPIELDPTDPDDLALFENFMLGKGVTLQVHGVVVGKLGSYKENADGEVTVTGKAAVKIHSLTLQSS